MTEIPPKLSKQQQFVLLDLWNWEKMVKEFIEENRGFRPDYSIPHSYQSVSRDVAEEFNKGHGDRIFDREEKLEENLEKANADLRKEDGEDYQLTEPDVILTDFLGKMIHCSRRHKNQVLWGSHSQSLSRAIRRLEDRGLVRRLYESQEMEDTIYRIPKEPGDQKTRKLILTDKGQEVASEIKRRAEDGRYSLEFDTLERS